MTESKKKLTEMTLEELWQLFPIDLAPHKPEWKDWANGEINLLHNILEDFTPIITHVGSTAIPNIQAKPIIDLLVELPNSADFDSIAKRMESCGYILMGRSSIRLSFNKGYTSDGYSEKVFHIHLRRKGDNDEILFLDYMITHPEEAKMYELLKQSLLPEYRHDRDGYTSQKTSFIKRILEKAKKLGPF